VQFIQYQELQPIGVPDNCLVPFVLPSHQQLQHHVVGQDDVGWVLHDSFPLFLVFLTGIAGVTDRPGVIGVVRQEFFQFFLLAVRQSVHRVDNDSADACCGVLLLIPDDRINHGYEVGE
jgi:hypothetical protein